MAFFSWLKRAEVIAQAEVNPLLGRVFELEKRELVDLDKFKLFVMPDDDIGRVIAATKQYEPHVTAALKAVLRPGNTFLDVGANIGFFSMMGASIVGASGRVISVEPNPQNAQLLFESIKANGFSVTLLPVAASDRYSIIGMFNLGSNGGVITDKMRRAEVPIWPTDPSFSAQSVKLDDLLGNLASLDVVKIDIEAHEPEALRGMSCLLKKHRPILFTEFHPWALSRMSEAPPVDYLHQLGSYGYSLSLIEEDGRLIKVEPFEVMDRWAADSEGTQHFDLRADPN